MFHNIYPTHQMKAVHHVDAALFIVTTRGIWGASQADSGLPHT